MTRGLRGRRGSGRGPGGSPGVRGGSGGSGGPGGSGGVRQGPWVRGGGGGPGTRPGARGVRGVREGPGRQDRLRGPGMDPQPKAQGCLSGTVVPHLPCSKLVIANTKNENLKLKKNPEGEIPVRASRAMTAPSDAGGLSPPASASPDSTHKRQIRVRLTSVCTVGASDPQPAEPLEPQPTNTNTQRWEPRAALGRLPPRVASGVSHTPQDDVPRGRGSDIMLKNDAMEEMRPSHGGRWPPTGGSRHRSR